jgi:Fe-S oxidoreductase
MKAGNFVSAYRDYRNKAVFPVIVAAVCDEPCRGNCPVDVEMRLLERAAVAYAEDRSPERFRLPSREGRVAIIGGGLSGLACALRLAAKRYDVAIFERDGTIGGSVKDLLPESVVLDEIEKQFANLDFALETGREIKDLGLLDAGAYDAAYIAAGAGGDNFGLFEAWNPQSLATARAGVFLGGRIAGGSHVSAIAQGLTAAVSVETYLKTRSMAGMRESWHIHECRIKPLENKEGVRPVAPRNGVSYSKEEASEEAGHCLNCDCLVCRDSCEFMKETGLTPRMIEVNASSERGPITRNSNRLIASCALCGHCEAVCDFDASVEKAMRRGKKMLFEENGFPPAYHDFYLRDMQDAMGASFLFRMAPGSEKATYLFFPGCQAPKDSPEYVLRPYRYMLENDPDTALMLACCGVPALFAGDIAGMGGVHKAIREAVRTAGNPTLVLACATCAKTFREFLPDMKFISIYEYMREKGLPEETKRPAGEWALFDPCSSRKFPSMQDAVRDLLEAAGTRFGELPENRSRALCCGQGGHIYAANPNLSRKFTAAATTQSALPYLTYCSNCRNFFLMAGKQATYLLDSFFGIEPPVRPPHLAERDLNRKKSKADALCEFWREADAGQGGLADAPGAMVFVGFSDAILRKADSLLITEDEIRDVIVSAEAGMDYLEMPEKGLRLASKRIGLLTVWAEYRPTETGFEAVNAYCHRIDFSLGRK